MRTAVVVLVIAVCAVLSSASSFGAGPPPTSLRISFWEDGSGGTPDTVWTLRCNPARGSLPQPARACRRLAAGGARLFAPVRPDTVCTEIYGGPQRAHVVGVLAGKRIWSTFTRTNGCEIDRWQRLSPWLLPPGGVT
jgi:hypothetical protein